MLYLKTFTFPDVNTELDYLWANPPTHHESYYPFKVLSSRDLFKLEFAPITILYGDNGSGKTTALNIIAEKLKLQRDSIYNKTKSFPDYVELCEIPLVDHAPAHSRIITSDDVFDYMLSVRTLNEGIDLKREDLFREFMGKKYADFRLQSMDDYEQLKGINEARRKTQSKYVKDRLMKNVREQSNGESAFKYFAERIDENALYLLDEPENSLSPARQIELASFLADSARFYKCQFIISTHSPFFLALQGAKIYDLDENPASIKQWTDLENVRAYYDFFKSHEKEF